jgi:hypothetical protein
MLHDELDQSALRVIGWEAGRAGNRWWGPEFVKPVKRPPEKDAPLLWKLLTNWFSALYVFETVDVFCARNCSGLGYYEERVSTDGWPGGKPPSPSVGSGQAVQIQTLSPELGQRPCDLSPLAEVLWRLLEASLFGTS